MSAGRLGGTAYAVLNPPYARTCSRRAAARPSRRRRRARPAALLCGDLFTQGGKGATPITESDILGPSEAFRTPMDYHAHGPNTATVLERLAREQPQVLARMHGSAWRGDGAAMLRALAKSLEARPLAAAA